MSDKNPIGVIDPETGDVTPLVDKSNTTSKNVDVETVKDAKFYLNKIAEGLEGDDKQADNSDTVDYLRRIAEAVHNVGGIGGGVTSLPLTLMYQSEEGVETYSFSGAEVRAITDQRPMLIEADFDGDTSDAPVVVGPAPVDDRGTK